MKKLTQFIIITISILFSSLSYGDSASSALTGILLNTQTMEADFSQTVKDKTHHNIQQTQGHMALVRPGKFRWEVKSPNQQLIVANGKRLWIYDPDLEQVTVQTFHAGSGKTPALLLSDKSLTLDKDYKVQAIPQISAIAGLQVFLLTPKDNDDPMNQIRLTFLNKKIHEMQLQDHLGHTTIITFQNVNTGMPLADTLFTFIPPVDVIDETKDHR
jgi:outer membrane lipoprotein carrier protein